MKVKNYAHVLSESRLRGRDHLMIVVISFLSFKNWIKGIPSQLPNFPRNPKKGKKRKQKKEESKNRNKDQKEKKQKNKNNGKIIWPLQPEEMGGMTLRILGFQASSNLHESYQMS